MTTIVWFRYDLRLADNPAFSAAISDKKIVPVFIFSPSEEKPWAPGAASKWWLHHSLNALSSSLNERGVKLIIRSGNALKELLSLQQECKANRIVWNRRYEPALVSRDKKIKETLKAKGIEAESFNGSLLLEPWESVKNDGTPYQVFTPFCKNLLNKIGEIKTEPDYKEEKTEASTSALKSCNIDELSLEPKINWAGGFSMWKPGELGAHESLKRFLNVATEYDSGRDTPGVVGTSRLSPHLHFGEISPKQILSSLKSAKGKKGIDTYIKEIVWREFAHHLLFHFPDTPAKPLRKQFEKFPWKKDKKALIAWQKGLTGYPIVDAGMRELWTTGWMHNRVRMIVGSFLVKDLLIPWQEGAAWFWDTLVDADLANNTLGWQWIAGCGADAAPYFRVFNPVLQGEKFDPEGIYVRRWIPELKGISDRFIHKPWEYSQIKDYPKPIVDHAEAREAALFAYEELK